MSKIINKNKNIEMQVMQKIKKGDIKMKPRWIFVAGSVLSFIGLAGSMFTSIFFINLVIFLVRKQGPGIGKLNMILSSFPAWIPVVAVLAIILGALLLSKYDFSYKRNFKLVILAFIASILVAGFVMDKFGINEVWAERGVMQKFYQDVGGYRRFENFPSPPPGQFQRKCGQSCPMNGYNKYR